MECPKGYYWNPVSKKCIKIKKYDPWDIDTTKNKKNYDPGFSPQGKDKTPLGVKKTQEKNSKLGLFKKGGLTKKVKVTAGGEKHVVYKKTTKKGEGKVGNIMVNHPTKDKGQWDTIDLTAKGRAKTVAQGVAATKKWHKDNPDYKYKGKGNGKDTSMDKKRR
jgi:hypothetical protein